MAFDPFREARSNLIGQPHVLQVPIYIEIEVHDGVPIVIMELLLNTINSAAIRADVELLSEFSPQRAQINNSSSAGFTELEMEKNRFLVTSMRRGSVIVAGTVLAGFAWAFKKFVEPGWDNSETKKNWDLAISHGIDRYADRFGQHIERLWGRTKWLRISNLSISRDDHGPKLLVHMKENPIMKDHRPED